MKNKKAGIKAVHDKPKREVLEDLAWRKKLQEEGEKYTDWQKEKIRKGIFAFKLGATLGISLSDYGVAEAIEVFQFGEKNIKRSLTKGQKRDHFFFIREEALRRFLAGAPTSLENLPIFKKFLMDEGILSKNEFKEADDTKDFIKIFAYLGNTGEEIEASMKKWKPCYQASKQTTEIQETVTLRLIRDDSKLFFRILERYELDTQFLDSSRKESSLIENRRGYACYSTHRNALHIFLRGEESVDRLICIQIVPPRLPQLGEVRQESFFLMRGQKHFPERGSGDDLAEWQYHLGLFGFSPVSLAESGFYDAGENENIASD